MSNNGLCGLLLKLLGHYCTYFSRPGRTTTLGAVGFWTLSYSVCLGVGVELSRQLVHKMYACRAVRVPDCSAGLMPTSVSIVQTLGLQYGPKFGSVTNPFVVYQTQAHGPCLNQQTKGGSGQGPKLGPIILSIRSEAVSASAKVFNT